MTFIELKPFSKIWQQLALTDDDLFLVQLAIMCDPQGPPVIPATGGIRKLRFAPSVSSGGKSGGMRCLYRLFDERNKVVLALVYPKNVRENISADDKKRLRQAMKEIEDEFNS